MPDMASIFVQIRKGALKLFFKTAVHWKKKNAKINNFYFSKCIDYLCVSLFFIIITVWMFYNQNRHGSPWLVIQADILCISSSPPLLLLLLLLLRLL